MVITINMKSLHISNTSYVSLPCVGLYIVLVDLRVIFVTESGWQVCGLSYHLSSILSFLSYIFGRVDGYVSFCHILSVAKPVHMSHFVNFHYRSSRYISRKSI